VSALASAIYEGTVSHARRVPRAHAFAYRVYMLYLDLGELPRLGLHAFQRADYLGDPSRDLAGEVLDRVERELGFRPAGPVRLLTHVRSLGYVFNPVSFYYCFDADGSTLRAVVAEITNTPWGERHAYVLPAGPEGVVSRFDKRFHVSPFFGMEQSYDWHLPPPAASLEVGMANLEDGREVFRARLALRRRAWSTSALRRAALLQPLMAWKVHAAIYWQALRLWLKGTPFHVHPAKRAATAAPRSTP
jgi:uncharacterized protein